MTQSGPSRSVAIIYNPVELGGDAVVRGVIDGVVEAERTLAALRAKWDAASEEYRATTPVFHPKLSEELRGELSALSVRAWDAIAMRDYARVDFRMDAGGRLYVLEANPNPDISAGSGYRRSLEAAGISYADFLGRLLDSALQRHTR